MNDNNEKQKVQELLAEMIAKYDYGAIISHDWISHIASIPYGTNKYKTIIGKTKRILIKKYSKVLESVKGIGYRIILPDEYTDNTLGHYKKGFKELQRGYEVIENAPITEMSPEGLEIHRRVYDRSTVLLASMQGVRAELKMLNKRRKPAPITMR